MQLSVAEQLKALKSERAGGSPDARWLASTRDTLMMQIGNTVGTRSGSSRAHAYVWNLRIFLPENMRAFLAVPLAVLLLAVGAGASSTAVVAAARDTLPGNPFYEVKLAAESVSLLAVGRDRRIERRIEIAGRRLDEIARLSTSSIDGRDAKIARVSGLFSDEMSAVRQELTRFQQGRDPEAAVKVAMQVEARTDAYQDVFQNGLLVGRPALRMALLSLDEVSVKALEILVERQGLAANGLPETQLTSAVGKRIDAFAVHVAAAEDRLPSKDAASPSMLLTNQARAAVAEAKQLLSQGDFRAAVRKVSESADLVSRAEEADKRPSVSASGTPVTASATTTVDSATQTTN